MVPLSGIRVLDSILAASGIISLTGEPDGRLVRPGVPIVEEAGSLLLSVF